MMDKKTKKDTTIVLSLNITLLTDDCKLAQPQEFIKDYKQKNVHEKDDKSYLLYRKTSLPKLPTWLDDFNNKFWGKNVNGRKNTSEGLVYIAKVTLENIDYLFAITFGGGRHYIEKNKINNDFGLYTALKLALSEGTKVKQAQSRTIEENPVNKNRMFGEAIEQQLFYILLDNNEVIKELNIKQNDLTKLQNAFIGKNSGLNVKFKFKSSQKPFVNILEKELLELLGVYLSVKEEDKLLLYKGLTPASKDKTKELNNKLISMLNDNENVFYLYEPEIDFDISKVTKYLFSLTDLKSYKNVENFDLKEYLSLCGNNISFESLQKDSVDILDENGEPLKSWTIFECLYGEYTDTNNNYILSNKVWYELPKSKFEKINENINKMQKIEDATDSLKNRTLYHVDLEDAEKKKANSKQAIQNENCFNKAYSEENNGILLDAKCISFEGNPFEICDIFFPENKRFVHVKIGKNANKLSHLFTQGGVSAYTYATSFDEYISKVNEKIKNTKLQLQDNHHGAIVDYIIVNDNSTNKLTYFSKIALNQQIMLLEAMGFKVKLTILNGINFTPTKFKGNNDTTK